MASRIKTNDEVIVISGRDKGKKGRVLRLLPKKDKVVVEGVNVITRHLRRNPQNPQAGGRVQKPAPIPLCRVMPWSESDKKGVRVKFEGEGRSKHRLAAKSSTPIVSHGKAKEKKASKKSS